MGVFMLAFAVLVLIGYEVSWSVGLFLFVVSGVMKTEKTDIKAFAEV